ncbi:methyltransferase [Parabacteroides sp. OttesenSCG-928-G06]|nr:methyltransferase [Parabacteroides sp. OttesenSCG-928-G06]
MPNSYFRFKQFTIRHDKCAMKVGTDGVLLGAWANTEHANYILDIGTGSGLIALMIAQRSQAQIDAIDIDNGAYIQACENSEASPFAKQINIYHQSLEDFAATTNRRYDLIVSNPPYFIDSLKPPVEKRALARHTDSLRLNDLISHSLSILSDNGRIALILPYDQEKELVDILTQEKLFIIRQTNVIPVAGGSPKRILVEITRKENLMFQKEELTIEIERHKYTSEYQTLTRDYYLDRSFFK